VCVCVPVPKQFNFCTMSEEKICYQKPKNTEIVLADIFQLNMI